MVCVCVCMCVCVCVCVCACVCVCVCVHVCVSVTENDISTNQSQHISAYDRLHLLCSLSQEQFVVLLHFVSQNTPSVPIHGNASIYVC